MLEDVGLVFEELLSLLLDALWKRLETAAKELEDLVAHVPHGLIKRALVEFGEWFRDKVEIFGIRREGKMELAGPLSQKACRLQIGPDQV